MKSMENQAWDTRSSKSIEIRENLVFGASNIDPWIIESSRHPVIEFWGSQDCQDYKLLIGDRLGAKPPHSPAPGIHEIHTNPPKIT